MHNTLLGGALHVILKRMGILEQYEKQFPEANKPAPQWQPASEYGFFVKLVMKLSGGRIRNERGANYVLLGVAGIIFFVAILIFIFSGPSSAGKARFSTVCFPAACPKE